MKTALSIAGFDPCGGAGILADIKTFHACGVYGCGAVSALTAQDTKKVYSTKAVDPETLREQAARIFEDFQIDCVKLGMLANEELATTVSSLLIKYKPPLVVLDPIIRSTSGRLLLSETGQARVIKELIPLTTIITPNLPEAEALSGEKIDSPEKMELAAEKIKELGILNVVLKGGHFKEKGFADSSNDFFLGSSEKQWLKAPRIKNAAVHGTGCVFSSALAAGLALGANIKEAVVGAKEFVDYSIRNHIKPGKGDGVPPIFPARKPSPIMSLS